MVNFNKFYIKEGASKVKSRKICAPLGDGLALATPMQGKRRHSTAATAGTISHILRRQPDPV